MGKTTKERIDAYLADNDAFASLKATCEPVYGDAVVLYAIPVIDYKGKNIINGTAAQEKAFEMQKVIPAVSTGIILYFNRPSKQLNAFVLPNPYFRDVLLANENMVQLEEYLSSVSEKLIKEGKINDVENIFFQNKTVVVNIKKDNDE